MKKKFLRGIAAALAVVMMMPTTALADETVPDPDSGIMAVSEPAITIDKELYNAGNNTTAQLTLTGVPAGTTVKWGVPFDGDIISVDQNTGVVTAKAKGTATVSARYTYTEGEGETATPVTRDLDFTVTVKEYKIVEAKAVMLKTDYAVGQTISKSDIKVEVKYAGDTTFKETTAFTFTPDGTLTTENTQVTVTLQDSNVAVSGSPLSINVANVNTSDLVKSFAITYPTSTTGFEVGKYLKAEDVEIELTYLDGNKYIIGLDNTDIEYSGISFTNGKYTFGSDDLTTAPKLTVKYADLPEQSVELKVTKPTEEKKLTGITVTTQPDKTFNVNDNFAFTGFGIRANYSDGTSRNITNADVTSQAITASPSVLSTAGTSVPVTLTFRENGVTVSTVIYVKVGQTVNVTGLSTSSSYKHSLYEDAAVEVGEELDWDELFSYVYIKYKDSNGNNQYKKIRDDSELESWLGTSAKLYAIVDSKTGSKKDIVEEDDIDDGEVKLELCFEYGSVDDTYEFNVKVSEIGCTVTVCRSSSSSTKIGSAKTFDKLKDALEYLEDESDIIDDFGVSSTHEDSFVIKIKLGEDQDLGTFEFAPDHEHAITIDLADYDLELESDWIDFEDCEDLKVTITNSENYSSSDKDDVKSKMEYSDEDVTLVVDKNDTYTFSEGKIPGIYAVTVKSGITNGKVEANKTTVNHGADVKFTITPNSGYEISDVKVNSKSVTKDSEYDVNSKGVATYTLKKADKDIEITATFKKAAAAATEKEEEKKPASTPAWNNPFTDVSTSAQYYKAVEFVCSHDPVLFTGMTATKFEPTTTMTRAMFVTVLGRLAGINEMQYSGTSFTDVSKSDQQIAWAAPYIEWAVQKGITNGTGNGKFSPNEPITHQQMYVFMQRYADKIEDVDISTTGVTLTSIKDAYQIDSWAEDGVKFASKHGILITSGGKLTPTDNALRCELAMLLHGFCVKVLGQ